MPDEKPFTYADARRMRDAMEAAERQSYVPYWEMGGPSPVKPKPFLAPALAKVMQRLRAKRAR